MAKIIWSIKELVDIIKSRQANEFDANIAVSGERGNGKSVLINKIFHRFPVFSPWKHQVYDREQIIELLKNQELGLCWDDEAINSGYKRDFQNKGQQELIKVLTAYRDNYNVYASAIPNFFSLDKDLRDLYFIHLHVIERGLAVVHMPSQGRLYSVDKWDAAYNKKIEEKWGKATKKNLNFKAPYHQLSTFRGYLYFEDVTPNQKKLYKEIKKSKRAKAFQSGKEAEGEAVLSFNNKLYKLLMEGKLSAEGLRQACLIEGKKYSTISSALNELLKDAGENGTLKNFLLGSSDNRFHNNVMGVKIDPPPSY